MATDDDIAKAASNLNEIYAYNQDTLNKQLRGKLKNYDLADEQNKKLLADQRTQYSRDTDVDRFQANRNLQTAARTAMNSLGYGLNGSQAQNVANAFSSQQDEDNVKYWDALRQSFNTADNAYQESLNSNNVGRVDATISAEAEKRDMEANQAAALNNLGAEYYRSPSDISSDSTMSNGYTIGSSGLESQDYTSLLKSDDRDRTGGYITSGYLPETQAAAGKTKSNDYFSRLLRRA